MEKNFEMKKNGKTKKKNSIKKINFLYILINLKYFNTIFINPFGFTAKI